jgi:hypothetical protein
VQEEKMRIQREHDAKVKKLTEEAFMEEQKQKRIEAETIAALTRAADANHPLRRFIKGVDPEGPAPINPLCRGSLPRMNESS